MNDNCVLYRDMIGRSIMADLPHEEQEAFDRHLAACPACASECSAYEDLIRQMQTVEDEPVPKHFFVYPKERSLSLWSLFRMMHPAWQSVAAGILILIAFVPFLAFSRLHIRAEKGSITFAFREIAPPVLQVQSAQPDTSALEARIVKIVEEKSRKESLEWVRTLRSEITRSQRNITPQQRLVLETALGNLEARLGNRIEDTAKMVIDRNERSIAGVFQTVTRQRERDLAVMDGRFNQLAVSSEIKSTQTDAILETLLQVAELRGN